MRNRHANRFGLAAALASVWACGQGTPDQAPLGRNARSPGAIGAAATSVVIDTSQNQGGRLTTSGNGLKRTFNQYDAVGRQPVVQHVVGDASYVYTTSYGYPQGSASGPGTVVTSSQFPDGETVRYTYDAAGSMTKMTSTPAGGTAQTIVGNVIRNVRGQTVEVDYGNLAAQYHCYNDGVTCNGATGPNTDLRLRQIATGLNGTIQQYTYSYDRNGNVTAVNDLKGDGTASYSYDSLDRLTGGTFAYAYDAIGNLTSKEGVKQTYFPSGPNSVHPHALSSIGKTTFSYDANGNLKSRSDGLTMQ